MGPVVTVLSLFLFSWGIGLTQEKEAVEIRALRAEPSEVSPGATVRISCQVTHEEGATFVERVAATVQFGNWVTEYPMLYDDGTHGDLVSGDGVYSLLVRAAEIPGEEKITFTVVDKGRREFRSNPISLTIR